MSDTSSETKSRPDERPAPVGPAEIIQALEATADVYPREAVQAALDQREAITPLLLEHLERVVADPELAVNDRAASWLLIFAAHLLGEFREPRAHRPLVTLSSLPGEQPFDLFSDMVTEELKHVLWMTSSGDITHLVELVHNEAANPYCRQAAILALTTGVAEGALEREVVVAILRDLLEHEEQITTEVVSALLDLWPGDSMDQIERAFEDGLVLDGIVGNLEEIKDEARCGKDEALAALKVGVDRWMDRTAHERMEWWACFNRDHPAPKPEHSTHQLRTLARQHFGYEENASRRPIAMAKKAAAKKKRKQAKAARKKGRKKKRR
jgi:hypothetical protein